jgi:hypothetical protein
MDLRRGSACGKHAPNFLFFWLVDDLTKMEKGNALISKMGNSRLVNLTLPHPFPLPLGEGEVAESAAVNTRAVFHIQNYAMGKTAREYARPTQDTA